jgi:putative transcriptional regulator
MKQFLTVGEHKGRWFLGGKVLIATPALDGSIFEKSLIYICSQDEDGATGVIFNKPEKYITEEEISEAAGLKRVKLLNRKFQIFTGGPIEEQKLFILCATKEQKKLFDKDQHLTLYSNGEEYLLDKIKGRNHDAFLVIKGYCGWAYGQLEA